MKTFPMLAVLGVCALGLTGCTIDADDDDVDVVHERETVVVPQQDDEPDHTTEVHVNE